MALDELVRIVPPPAVAMPRDNVEGWSALLADLGTDLPNDYRDFGLCYGSGYFDDPEHLLIFVWNPFGPNYRQELHYFCRALRISCGLPEGRNSPLGIFPDQSGWLPWGNDIDGNWMCWLTEGEPDDWPIILLSADCHSFQQLHMPMTTFLAGVFTRQIQTILWEDSAFFAGPEPVRFVPLPS